MARGRLAYVEGPGAPWGPIQGQPVGLAAMFPATDYPMDPGTAEYWQGMNGNLCAAAAAMNDAMEWLARTK